MRESRDILVIGATGRLGSLLVRHLASRGRRITAVVRPTPEAARPVEGAAEVVYHDLVEDFDVLETLCRGFPLVVFAAGARARLYATDPDSAALFHAVNTRAVAAVARSTRLGGGRLIHLGSVFALGMTTHGGPQTPFECSKAAAEVAIHAECAKGLRASVLRLASVLGPYPPGTLQCLLATAKEMPVWNARLAALSGVPKPALMQSDFLRAFNEAEQSTEGCFFSNVYRTDVPLATFWEGVSAQPQDSTLMKDGCNFLRRFMDWDGRIPDCPVAGLRTPGTATRR